MEFAGGARAAAIPDDLRALSDELQALGGGDTRVADLEAHCRVQPLPPAVDLTHVAARAEANAVVVRYTKTTPIGLSVQ